MKNDQPNSDQSAHPAVASAGWSAKRIRIGRVELEFVKIHDSAGAHHFDAFVSSTIANTRRRRQSAGATRYLEHIPHTVPARLLSEEAADYLRDMQRRELSRSSLMNQTHYFRLLTLAAGDIPVSMITCDHIREFWEVLRWWPKNAGSQKKFEGKTDAEILALGKASNREPPAQATMLLAERQIAAFFNRLLKKRVISSSPLDGFGQVKKSLVQITNTRRAFTDVELTSLFSEEHFLPWASRSPHAWWAPLIGLFTGARVGEVAQLKVADVFEENGMWCFHFRITPDADGQITQSLKGASSIRIVPVATQLIDLGFLDFIEDIKACGHARLFPHLKRGVDKETGKPNGAGYGASLSQKFAGHLRKSHPSIEAGLAFHGFRHTLATALGLAGNPVELVASITGHDEDKSKPTFAVLQKHYLHMSSPIQRQAQLAALVGFTPPIDVPRYVRGQFADKLGANAKMYP
jgi:integrase